MAGPPQREPDSVPSAGRSAVESMGLDQAGNDVIEAGRPPRRPLSRKVTKWIEVVCGMAVVLLVGATAIRYFGWTDHTESPSLIVDGTPVPSYGPRSAEFAVTLTNDGDAPIIIDNVQILNEDYAEQGIDPWAPYWVVPRIHPPNIPIESGIDVKPLSVEVAGNGGEAVLEVKTRPTCGHLPEQLPAEVVIVWHTEPGQLDAMTLPDLLNDGPTSLETMVHEVCDAQ